jgi:hypothetical protein
LNLISRFGVNYPSLNTVDAKRSNLGTPPLLTSGILDYPTSK